MHGAEASAPFSGRSRPQPQRHGPRTSGLQYKTKIRWSIIKPLRRRALISTQDWPTQPAGQTSTPQGTPHGLKSSSRNPYSYKKIKDSLLMSNDILYSKQKYAERSGESTISTRSLFNLSFYSQLEDSISIIQKQFFFINGNMSLRREHHFHGPPPKEPRRHALQTLI